MRIRKGQMQLSLPVLLMLVASCGAARINGAAVAGASPQAEGICRNRLAYSMGAEDHIVNDLPAQQKLRSLSGNLASSEGAWPSQARPILDITPLRAPRTDWSLRILVGPDGEFSGPPLPDGDYCVKASASGWQSAIGKIQLSSSAAKTAMLKISLELGV